MRKYFAITGCLLLTALFSNAQLCISGTVSTEANEPLSGVSVTIKGSKEGTITNNAGYYSLSTTALPITLIISSVGFEQKQIEVKSEAPQQVKLVQLNAIANVVVVSATRIPMRLMEAPVSIEPIGLQAIRTTAATSYYDMLVNAKGVDFVTSGLLFKTPTTRGFAQSGNSRFNQIMDGMDNQSPGMNFSIGSFIGLTELDVESMELLPGASSALYGAGGMNGTLLINSKNPFQYQGLSILGRQGAMHIDKRQRPDASLYTDWSLRYAKAYGRFAFKVGAQYIHTQDWLATDSTNYSRLGSAGGILPGNRQSDPNYDGVNIYGDETNTSGAGMRLAAMGIQQAIRQHILDATGGALDIVALYNQLPAGAPMSAYGQIINALPPS